MLTFPISVHSGKDLRKVDIFGKGDPYVIVKVNTNIVYTTTVKGGDNPKYEESTEVSWKYGRVVNMLYALTVTV